MAIFGLHNGLLPVWQQAFIWTNDDILLIEILKTNLIKNLIKLQLCLYKKINLKKLSAKMTVVLSQPQSVKW